MTYNYNILHFTKHVSQYLWKNLWISYSDDLICPALHSLFDFQESTFSPLCIFFLLISMKFQHIFMPLTFFPHQVNKSKRIFFAIIFVGIFNYGDMQCKAKQICLGKNDGILFETCSCLHQIYSKKIIFLWIQINNGIPCGIDCTLFSYLLACESKPPAQLVEVYEKFI